MSVRSSSGCCTCAIPARFPQFGRRLLSPESFENERKKRLLLELLSCRVLKARAA
jgi:hypothetical protein